MSHAYICERCHKTKTCQIAGCNKGCAPVCGSCLHKRRIVKHCTVCGEPLPRNHYWAICSSECAEEVIKQTAERAQ